MTTSVAMACAATLLAAGLAVAPAAPVGADVPAPAVFGFAGAGVDQTYVVPPGVTQLDLRVMGAGGGRGGDCLAVGTGKGGDGGLGAFVLAQVIVQPGDTLTIHVGQRGVDGSAGCGGGGGTGGGASWVILSGVPAVVAGGGGGGGGGGEEFDLFFAFPVEGGRGGDSGQDGHTSAHISSGHGGSAHGAGGKGGTGFTDGTPGGPGSPVVDGLPGPGGAEGDGGVYKSWAGAEGGGGGQGWGSGGGGGGGAASDFLAMGSGGGGAGGMNRLDAAGSVIDGFNASDGQVVVTPVPSGAPPGEAPPPPAAPDALVPPPSTSPGPAARPVVAPPRFTG